MSIDINVTNLFKNNHEFMILNNEDDEDIPYEIPVIGYVFIDEDKVNFCRLFGTSRETDIKNSIFGLFYYFTTFECLMQQQNEQNKNEQNKNEQNKNKKITRHVLFMGNTKVKMNYENELEDSLIKTEKQKNLIKKELKYEKCINYITDYDGRWSMTHDSLFVGPLQLTKSKESKESKKSKESKESKEKEIIYLKNAPIVVIKNINQQKMLDYL